MNHLSTKHCTGGPTKEFSTLPVIRYQTSSRRYKKQRLLEDRSGAGKSSQNDSEGEGGCLAASKFDDMSYLNSRKRSSKLAYFFEQQQCAESSSSYRSQIVRTPRKQELREMYVKSRRAISPAGSISSTDSRRNNNLSRTSTRRRTKGFVRYQKRKLQLLASSGYKFSPESSCSPRERVWSRMDDRRIPRTVLEDFDIVAPSYYVSLNDGRSATKSYEYKQREFKQRRSKRRIRTRKISTRGECKIEIKTRKHRSGSKSYLEQLEDIFASYDLDSSGFLDRGCFEAALKSLGVRLDSKEISGLMRAQERRNFINTSELLSDLENMELESGPIYELRRVLSSNLEQVYIL